MEQLAIERPIIQAGMAGGITTPQLVSAVANEGALGTIGAGYMDASTLKKQISKTKQRTNQSFAVNLFATDLQSHSNDVSEMQQFLNRYRQRLGIDNGKSSVTVHDDLQEKITVILEENIPVVSTAFGVLSAESIKRLKQNRVILIGMATYLAEAEELIRAGYDIIVAQGSEAGGHRGTFSVDQHPNGCNIGLFALIEQFVNHLSVPVIAAGGIHTGKQVKALLDMGASGVQIGTRFLVDKEAGTNNAYRQALLAAKSEDTVITKVFSGRPARAIHNRLIEEVETSDIPIQPFPLQNELTKDVRAAGKAQGVPDVQSLWAGQSVGAIKTEETVAEMIADLSTP